MARNQAKAGRDGADSRLADWIILAGACVCLALGVGFAGWSLWQLATYERAEAKVQPAGYGAKGSAFFTASYEGATIEVKDRFAWLGGSSWRPGDTVTVLYPKGAPQDGFVETFIDLWTLPLFFAVVGLAFGCGILRNLRRRGARDDAENPALTAEELLALDRKRRRGS